MILLNRASFWSRPERTLAVIDLLSQVALAEASLDAQNKEYGLACQKFVSMKSEYRDLLAEHDDFALELDSRLACAFVDAKRYGDAVPVFRRLFERQELEDKQRLQVFFSVALISTGQIAEAQPLLVAATKGGDATLSKTALEYLTGIEKAQ